MADGTKGGRLPGTAKVPPHSEEAEMSVLGGLMLDSAATHDVMTMIAPGDFYQLKHRLIFEAFVTLQARRSPVDFITVADMLRDTGQLDAIDGLPYLGSLVSETPGVANLREYAQIVREKALRRRMIATGSQIMDLGYQTDGTAADDLVQIAQIAASELTAGIRTKEPVLVSALVPQYLAEVDSRARRGTGGLQTGFASLDDATKGLEPGDVVVIAGRPGTGKTALALNIGANVAAAGGSVLGFSLEMPSQQWIARMAANLSSIPMDRLKRPWELDDADSARLTTGTGHISGLNFRIDDTPALSIQRLSSIARRAHGRNRLSLIVADYLQLMQGNGGKREEIRSQEIDGITRGIKALAKELGCPILLLSQFNRDLEKRDNKRPRLADLRESGGIEQDADVVLGLYRDELYNPDSADRGLAEVHVLKQRNGPTGTVFLEYQGEYFRFTDTDRRPAQGRSTQKPLTGFAAMRAAVPPVELD